jgi:hypothetical protein
MHLSRFLLLSACGFVAVHCNVAMAGNRFGAGFAKAQREAAIMVVTPQQKPATLADFAWLAGRWEGKLGAPGSDKQMIAEQEWMAPKNGTTPW